MKLIVVAALLALSFATGFTCSKNAPTEQPAAPTSQEQMAAPAASPADGQANPPPAEPPPAEGQGQAPAAGSETK